MDEGNHHLEQRAKELYEVVNSELNCGLGIDKQTTSQTAEEKFIVLALENKKNHSKAKLLIM